MEEETIIISALSTLNPNKLKHLTYTILSLSDHRHRRLAAILSSPILFSLTLHHLHSVSLSEKALLIARYLLLSLQLITQQFHQTPSSHHHSSKTFHIKQRDLDTVLLLLLLCEVHQQSPEELLTPQAKWPVVLSKHFCQSALSLHGIIGAYEGAVLLPYIEMVTRCMRFVNVMGGGGGKEGREVAAAVEAVVGLPSVEVKGADVVGDECVICKEEMREGRDVCELPCEHLFHWMCILPWLKKKNTCPYCRFRLPTDDVFGEIERLWEVLVKVRSGSVEGECM